MKKLKLFFLTIGVIGLITSNVCINHAEAFKTLNLKSLSLVAHGECECQPDEFCVEFCDEGDIGVCCDKVGELGFSCVETCGEKDCSGTHEQCI